MKTFPYNSKFHKLSDEERFKHRLPENLDPDTCWIWQGSQSQKGYGEMSNTTIPGKYAHRLSYTFFKGPIPVGLVIRHTCDTPLCVNPDHLLVGTQKQNIRDCIERGRWRKTYGPRGPYNMRKAA